MFYNKYPHPANFSYLSTASADQRDGGFISSLNTLTADGAGKTTVRAQIASYPGGVHSLTVRSDLWPRNHSQGHLNLDTAGTRPAPRVDPPGAPADTGADRVSTLALTDTFGLRLTDDSGAVLLQTQPGTGFGVSGTQSILILQSEPDDKFYGMGEKWFGKLELSGVQTKYWNTDVWVDFAYPTCVSGTPDPVYAAIPYLIVRRGDRFLGILVNNPGPVFMRTGAIAGEETGIGRTVDDTTFAIGSESGPLDVIIIDGPTLPGLTRKYQRLVGTTPLPPVWSLGYHQCRWGYGSRDDLTWLNTNMDRHTIPCDGIWLDIDYMDEYRVFTFSSDNFPEPAKDLANAQDSGRRVVPILDPGVKRDPGYAVFDSGLGADAFCHNPQGNPYVGLVWPGETVFPDFSTEGGRLWWSDRVAKFAALGIHGAWVDMNDPSTGTVLATDMLFDSGREAHETFHNQYGSGMAAATREGFLAAHPDERPFLLCRSASTGSGAFTALWTGDNFSNYHHLKNAIATTLNLALSGIPFNGPDVGGFGGDAWEQLLIDWTKACFLFPFFRNHSAAGTRSQEPWSFDTRVLEVTRAFIQLRYRLRPYLYNLFIRHEMTGEAILRPIIYDYPNDRRFDDCTDQFMIGPDILHAPFVTESEQREVVLPAGPWYALDSAEWIAGGGTVSRAKEDNTTPLFFREGAVIPWSTMPAGENRWDGSAVQFIIFMSPSVEDGSSVGAPDAGSRATAGYVWDDGISTGYTTGERSILHISARLEGSTAGLAAGKSRLLVTVTHEQSGFGVIRPAIAILGEWNDVDLTVDGVPAPATAVHQSMTIDGRSHAVTLVRPAP
jgi:alpha-glucosidase